VEEGLRKEKRGTRYDGQFPGGWEGGETEWGETSSREFKGTIDHGVKKKLKSEHGGGSGGGEMNTLNKR